MTESINNIINKAKVKTIYANDYGDIVINCLANAVNLDEFYKQEIEEVKYIINADLQYSGALLYINSRLYINTDTCCVYMYGSKSDLAYKQSIPNHLTSKIAYLHELARNDYDAISHAYR